MLRKILVMSGRKQSSEASEASEDEDIWGSDPEDEEGVQGPQPEFFDPDLDTKDEAWVNRQRGGRRSDAILSCPGCLTTICVDCQQHADKEGQFRAMFCINVR